VYPAEVERVLLEHPAVAEAAVLGVPDRRLGERVVAAVRLADGATASDAALRDHCRTAARALQGARRDRARRGLAARNAMAKVIKARAATAVRERMPQT
jgi:acyl-CoA synthetase (AMP-forming)/AMP-acid ligase II